MRTNRFYTPEALSVDGRVELEGKVAHYLSRVLRLAEGDEVVLFNGDGFDYPARLVSFSRKSTVAQVTEKQVNHTTSPLKIVVCQAINRGDRMDYCLQKATELGVSMIRLLMSERVEVKLNGDRLSKRMEHWRGVIRSACEQSGRASVPGLLEPVSIDEWTQIPGTRLVLDSKGEHSLAQFGIEGEVELAVGPEGGFSDPEIDRMSRAGVHPVRLGPRILRTETAGPAAIAVLQSRAGDLV